MTAPRPAQVCGGRCPGWACNATLNPHNITGICAECKYILRDERRTGIAAAPSAWVTPEQAAENLLAVVKREAR